MPIRCGMTSPGRPTCTQSLTLVAWLIAIFFQGMLAEFAFAKGEQWLSLSLPTSPSSIDGFTAEIQLIHPESEGYLPLRFAAKSSGGPFPGDRLIDVQITPGRENIPSPQTAYTIRLTLPAGQSFFEQTYYLPKWFSGRALQISIRDRNGPLGGYSTLLTGNTGPRFSRFNFFTESDIFPRIAVLIPEPGNQNIAASWRIPDLRSWDSLFFPNTSFMNAKSVERLDDEAALDYLRTTSTTVTQILRPSTAHDRWLGYESIDVIIASFSILEELRSERPERFEAIRQWLSTGGVLWTFGTPETETLADFFNVTPPPKPNAEEVTPIDRSLAKMLGETSVVSSPTARNWLQILQQTGELSGEQANLAFAPLRFSMEQLAERNHPFAAKPSTEELRRTLQPLAIEAGTVIGIRDEDPFPGSYTDWYTIRHLSGANQYWTFRRGTSLVRGSNHFWEWMLNNVSRPPVYGFLALLTLFVILVGPVSYQILRRIGRTHLIFLVAPLLAIATTTMLFIYGFLADGLRPQTRIRQITWTDGTSGRSATMKRATYYAPFRNTRGMIYSENEAIYPTEDGNEAVERLASDTYRLSREWFNGASSQQFQGDILPSRTQRQFLSYQPTKSFDGIRITPNGSSVTVKNSMTVPLEELYYRIDEKSYLQLAKPCPPGDTAALEKVDVDLTGRKLRQLYMATQPEVPLGFVRDANYGRSLLSFRMNDFDRSNESWATPNDSWGIYESRLRTMLLDQSILPIGWFVGSAPVAENSSAVQGAKAIDSIHFIMGTLP